MVGQLRSRLWFKYVQRMALSLFYVSCTLTSLLLQMFGNDMNGEHLYQRQQKIRNIRNENNSFACFTISDDDIAAARHCFLAQKITYDIISNVGVVRELTDGRMTFQTKSFNHMISNYFISTKTYQYLFIYDDD